MSYFRLSPDCLLAEGGNGAALYDVRNQRVYLLDGRAYRFLRHCENNGRVDEKECVTGAALLAQLESEGLGAFEPAPAFIDKWLPSSPVRPKGFLGPAPRYRMVYWSITNRCLLDCSFCGTEGTVTWQTCLTCLRRDRGRGDGPCIANVEETIGQLAKLNVETIVVRGGDPFLALDRLREIRAAVLRRPRIMLVVVSPGLARTAEEILDFLNSPRVRLLIVLFGLDAVTTRTVTGHDDVHERQRMLLGILRDRRLAFHSTMLLTEATRERHEDIADEWRRQWGTAPQFAECYEHEMLRRGGRFVIPQPGAKRLAPWLSPREFFWRIQNKPCLYGQFEIDLGGSIRPCPGLSEVCGEIRNDDLRRALMARTLYDRWWSMSKSSVKSCSNCALRFACNDCATVEILGAADPAVKQAYCSYDPDSDEMTHERAWSPPEFVKILRG